MNPENSVVLDDLSELMRVLGISTHARSESPHEVFQNEVLEKVKRWREALGRVCAEAEYATNGDDLYTITGTTHGLVWTALHD